MKQKKGKKAVYRKSYAREAWDGDATEKPPHVNSGRNRRIPQERKSEMTADIDERSAFKSTVLCSGTR